MADILASSRASLPAWIADTCPPTPKRCAPRSSTGCARTRPSCSTPAAGRRRARARADRHGDRRHHLLPRGGARRTRRLLLREGARARAVPSAHAFRGVVFAQVKISAINTALTAIYLLGILPLLGIHLPYTKALIAVTFFARPAAGIRQPDLEHRDRGREPVAGASASPSARSSSSSSSTSSSTSSTRASSAREIKAAAWELLLRDARHGGGVRRRRASSPRRSSMPM